MKKNYKAIVAKIIGALLPLVIMGCSSDYVDEYGINHGKGIEIDGVVWAPVNCGYHATDYPWGKLYQWGRKYGQGYSGNLYDVDRYLVGTIADATTPTLVEGPVSLAIGNSESNSNLFYTGEDYSYDWLSPHDNTLWNSGTEDAPIKTEYDPCPEGWRVPSYGELNSLRQNCSGWTTNELGQSGYWFSGSGSYSETSPRVFFSAAGYRLDNDGDAKDRGYFGYYWSSGSRDDFNAYSLGFFVYYANVHYYHRAEGYSVRCVQE